MQRICFSIILSVIAIVLHIAGAPIANAVEPQETDSTNLRVQWTTSKIFGSPDPPLPYRTEQIYSELQFKQPVEMVTYPEDDLNCIIEREGKIFLFPQHGSQQRTEFFDGQQAISGLTAVYGIAFHPDFAQNRICYVCYILEPGNPRGTRVSRFHVTDSDPPRIDAASETILLEWISGGHNGGSLKFGPDGYLYISTGDGSPPSPPDIHDTGQNIDDLLASILRIDVNSRTGDNEYGIPNDNPFVDMASARPEVWAYGFRNPWRMSFDRNTGELWLGDVGWQLWEMVYRVERGGNYGWSIMEGPQVVRPNAQPGPTNILPPIKAHPRSEAASMTGGFVYRGKRFDDLQGAYIYGDYVTGKIWSIRHDGNEITEHRELVDTPFAIIAFYEFPDGELALMDYNTGTIHQLVPNDQADVDPQSFPRKLSETGLFAFIADHLPAPGVVPFAINTAQWADHATAVRFVAIPGTGTIRLMRPRERVPLEWGQFPPNTVLVKTISLEMEQGNPQSRRRLETQILHNREVNWRGNSGEWFGYSYIWNEDQTDAELAPAAGADLKLSVADADEPGGVRKQTWHVSGRSECYLCHNPWAGYRLAFTVPQLSQAGDHSSAADDQLEMFQQIGLVSLGDRWQDWLGRAGTDPDSRERRLVDPHDTSAGNEARARSYMHVNCAHCHRFGGGGTATIDLRLEASTDEMQMIGVRPTQGTFRIANAQIVAPGDPLSSVLYYRVSKLGKGRMPHIGSQLVDTDGMDLLRQWIRDMPAQGQRKVADGDWSNRLKQLMLKLQPSDEQTPANQELVDNFLDSTTGALRLMQAIDAGGPSPMSAQIARYAARNPQAEIRDLFERFLPADERVERLGSVINPEQILAAEGNPDAGKRLFFEVETMDCKKCHRLGTVGGTVGPELKEVGKRLTRRQLLESIVEPSKTIDVKYVPYVVETKQGRVLTGLLSEQTESHLVLKDANDKTVRIESDDVEFMAPQRKSLMPEMLYRDMTAQQLADLLAFLESLR